MAIPMDLAVFNELQIVGSLSCPIGSYTGLLSMVAAGTLQPTRLVERAVAVADAGEALNAMSSYSTLGFSVINDWTAKPASSVSPFQTPGGAAIGERRDTQTMVPALSV
jgi:hypothetical protein